MVKFHVVKCVQDSGARAGELMTPHGAVLTPVFMPVASQGSVKTLTPEEVRGLGIAMILANTYHLYLRPSIETVEKMGGLHKYMRWDGPILTDSGGYQIFSLARLRRVDDRGVTFRSHIDGSEHMITPESAIRYQKSLGADIIMVLDECPSADDSFERVQEATLRTHLWAERCKRAHKGNQALFAIIQGGFFLELRCRSAEFLVSLDFPGYGIGGLSLGEPKEATFSMVGQTVALLPRDKPRYLMGVGSPEDIIEGVARGVDMFDSALPTRIARNGAFFTSAGRINIRNSAYRQLESPVAAGCGCYTCRHFSASYLHHLFRCEELLAYRLSTIHNLYFLSDLMQQIRNAILEGTFTAFKGDFLAGYRTTDGQVRLDQKQRWISSQRQRGR